MKKIILIISSALIVCIIGFFAYKYYTPTLTLEKLEILSEKGEDLTWDDFEKYKSVAGGSGIYILFYDIDDDYSLSIGGIPSKLPMYINLRKKDTEKSIDIRTESVSDFIKTL